MLFVNAHLRGEKSGQKTGMMLSIVVNDVEIPKQLYQKVPCPPDLRKIN